MKMREEPRFSNLTTLTVRLVNQYFENQYRDKSSKFRNCVLIAAAILLLVIVVIISRNGLNTWVFVDVFAELLLLWVFAYGYRFKAIKQYELIQRAYGRNPDITYAFFEKEVRIRSSKVDIILDYNQIDSVEKTKELYVLIVGDTYIFIARNGFMSGNRKRFFEFIESRIGEKV